MNRNRLAVIIIILISALGTPGCGGAAGGGGTTNTAAPAVAAASPSPTTAGTANVSGANVSGANADSAPPLTAAGGEATRQGEAQPHASRAAGGSTAAKMPTPQVGSGGNDLFLFTQARAAVNKDPELKAANIVIDVKEGVVTLSGAVASAALKSRAEELARGSGPKAVTNQLRVSAGR